MEEVNPEGIVDFDEVRNGALLAVSPANFSLSFSLFLKRKTSSLFSLLSLSSSSQFLLSVHMFSKFRPLVLTIICLKSCSK